MEWIAGDIGGTKSWLAWVGGSRGLTGFERRYDSAAFASAGALLEQFVRDSGHAAPDGVMLALPAPLGGRQIRLTNLDWTLDADTLRQQTGAHAVRFVNDFEAAAAGIETLGPADLLTLNGAEAEADGVRVVTGAGTGLGVAFLVADGAGGWRRFASEGGHADFAPADARQARLLERLRAAWGHVSWERVASGLALGELYAFCSAENGAGEPQSRPDGAELSRRAGAGDEIAEAALDLFVELYGAWVGNLALLYRPRGGLYLAGGVSQHLAARLAAPRFMAAATDKGRMRGVVEATPVCLVTQPRLGLNGAVRIALESN